MTALDRMKAALAQAGNGTHVMFAATDLKAVIEAVEVLTRLPPESAKAAPFTRAEVVAMPALGPMSLDMHRFLATVEAMEYWRWRCSDHTLQRSRDMFVIAAQGKDIERARLKLNALRDKAVGYLDRSRPFSEDGQADSDIRSDLQRELTLLAQLK